MDVSLTRPRSVDLLVAGGLLAWAAFEAVMFKGPGPLGARIGYAVLISAPLAFRRQAPIAVAAILVGVTVAWGLYKSSVADHGTMPYPPLLFGTFSVACYARRLLVGAAAGVLLLAAAIFLLAVNWFPGSNNASFGGVVVAVLFFTGAWAAGWLVRQRAAEARRAVAESGTMAQLAVAEERTRIARELHDVVAHSVSIMAVQAGAAEELLDVDLDRAREHIAQVRRVAREAMTEMRRVLDVLRTDEPRFAPQPGIGRLPDLIEEARQGGIPVEMIEEGDHARLPAGLDLVVYRVVQESLTNVRKHAAGASTRVVLRYAPAHVEIEVTNGPGARNGVPPAQAGHGLIGMRERVHLFGGRLQVGASANGGYRVYAVLPVTEEPA